MSAVRPGPPSAGEGHHDLHAADQVHVLQPGQRRASQQETEDLRLHPSIL